MEKESDLKLSVNNRPVQLIGLSLLVSMPDVISAGPIVPLPEPGPAGLLALCAAAVLIARSLQVGRFQSID